MSDVFFSGTVKRNGTDFPITATIEDDARTIMKKALDLEFYGEIDVISEARYLETDKLPDKFIFFAVAYARHGLHADDRPQLLKTHFDVTFVTKQKSLKATIPKRIINSLLDKGFLCVTADHDLDHDMGTEYFATQQEFVWIGVVG